MCLLVAPKGWKDMLIRFDSRCRRKGDICVVIFPKRTGRGQNVKRHRHVFADATAKLKKFSELIIMMFLDWRLHGGGTLPHL